jgi:CdiI N-terminal domain
VNLKSIFEGNSKTALVVSYDNPNASSNLEIWRVYREGEWLYFQNQLLQYSSLPQTFQISEIGRHIPDRAVITKDGNQISEWDVHIRDLEMFLWRSGAL